MVNKNIFTPIDFKVHRAAIERLIGGITEHHQGLAEWAKNSYGAYLDEDFDLKDRVIVFIFRNGNKRTNIPATITCMDFAGMDLNIFKKWGDEWGNPEAAPAAVGHMAGHGTGGKAYFSSMFKGDAFLYSVKNSLANCRGVTGTDPGSRVSLGVFGQINTPIDNIKSNLNLMLQENCGITFDKLPETARKVFDKTNSFTIAVGIQPNEIKNNRPASKEYLDNLIASGQMLEVLESTNIFVVDNRGIQGPIKPKQFKEVDQRTIPIPSELVDEQTNDIVETRADKKSTLVIKQTEKPLFRSNKDFNKFLYKTTDGGVIGEEPTNTFINHALSRNIRGEVTLDILKQYGNEMRNRVQASPIKRALDNWMSGELYKYVEAYDNLEKRETKKEDRERNVNLITSLNNWKNQFLDETLGLGGNDDEGNGGKRPITKREAYPKKPVKRIAILGGNFNAGIDVKLNLNVRFFGENDEDVRPISIDWVIDDLNVCTVDENYDLETHSPGSVEVFCKTNNGIDSNKLSITVYDFKNIVAKTPTIEVDLFKRKQIHVVASDRNGKKIDDPHLFWMSGDTNTVLAGGNQGFVKGVKVGKAFVYAGSSMEEIAEVSVIDSGGGPENKYPELLLSNDQSGPFTEIQRLNEREGPLVQRPQDVNHNIWWINKDSPMAKHIVDRYQEDSTNWRQYIFQCFVEMITRISIKAKILQGLIDLENFETEWNEIMAEVYDAGKILLNEVINEGDLGQLLSKRNT